jgi:putative polyhydroxyalkanoate system protein
MADIDIKRAHKLGLRAARAAADKMAEHLGQRFGLAGDWDGNVLHFERPGVTGALAVDEKDLRLTVNLGFLLRAMRGSIEAAVHEELDKLFANAPEPSPPGKARAGSPRPKKAAARPKKGG